MSRCSITDDKNSDHKLLGKRRINRIILRLDISPAEDNNIINGQWLGKRNCQPVPIARHLFSCPLLAQLLSQYLRNWAMFLVVVVFLFRTGSKNSEDDPADDPEETLWCDWSWYQSWQRRGISGARKTSDYFIDCTKHQERVPGDGQKLPSRISKQPEGRICGRGLNTGCPHNLWGLAVSKI